MVILAASGDWIGILIFFAVVVFNIIGSVINAQKKAAQAKQTPRARRRVETVEPVDPTDPFGPLWEAFGKKPNEAPSSAPFPVPYELAKEPAPAPAQPATPTVIVADTLREQSRIKRKLAAKLPPPPPRVVAAVEEEQEGPRQVLVNMVLEQPAAQNTRSNTLRNLEERRNAVKKDLRDPEGARRFFLAQEIFRPATGWSYDPPF
jgi:hypothetical protein